MVGHRLGALQTRYGVSRTVSKLRNAGSRIAQLKLCVVAEGFVSPSSGSHERTLLQCSWQSTHGRKGSGRLAGRQSQCSASSEQPSNARVVMSDLLRESHHILHASPNAYKIERMQLQTKVA